MAKNSLVWVVIVCNIFLPSLWNIFVSTSSSITPPRSDNRASDFFAPTTGGAVSKTGTTTLQTFDNDGNGPSLVPRKPSLGARVTAKDHRNQPRDDNNKARKGKRSSVRRRAGSLENRSSHNDSRTAGSQLSLKVPYIITPLSGNNTDAFRNATTVSFTQTTLDRIQISRDSLHTMLPPWLVEFMDWQQEQLRSLTRKNWHSGDYRFLILRCTKNDFACGGLSDRLKPLPYLLRVAYESKRLFFIRWDRPHPLEEFLLPTSHFNWSVPEYMEQKLKVLSTTVSRKNTILTMYNPSTSSSAKKNDGALSEFSRLWAFNKYSEFFVEESKLPEPIILEAKKQLGDGGRHFFAELVQDANQTYEALYHGIFRALFQPSPGVAALVEQHLDHLGLVPGKYSVAHYRGFYGKTMDEVPTKQIESFARNAVKCASQLHSGYPIYFASDSTHASASVKSYADRYHLSPRVYTTLSIPQNKSRPDPLHLEFAGRGNQTWPAEAFYDTFVDLLVLGNSRCISHGAGGYGEFANLVSFDPSCKSRHTVKTKLVDCKFRRIERVRLKAQ